MNNLPSQMLRRIVDKYGREVCRDARRCEALLNDLCGGYRREINVLVNAIEENIPLDLLARTDSMSLELLLTRLEKRLEEHTALTAEAARWSVESWALALGAATEVEIAERERKRTAISHTKKDSIETASFENKQAKEGVSNTNRTNAGQPAKPPVSLPKKSPPSLSRQPVNIPSALPPVRLPAQNQPKIQPPPINPQIQSSNPAVAAKSRFGLFRGCLFLIFLLALSSLVLFLGMPYAIEVMRETQRERNNEPPRFPAR